DEQAQCVTAIVIKFNVGHEANPICRRIVRNVQHQAFFSLQNCGIHGALPARAGNDYRNINTTRNAVTGTANNTAPTNRCVILRYDSTPSSGGTSDTGLFSGSGGSSLPISRVTRDRTDDTHSLSFSGFSPISPRKPRRTQRRNASWASAAL